MPEISRWLVTFLLNALWQITAIALLAALCARLLRHARHGQIHILWVLALAACLLVPSATLVIQTRAVAQPGAAYAPAPAADSRASHARGTAVAFHSLSRSVSLSPSLLRLGFWAYLALLLWRIARLGLLLTRTSHLRARAFPMHLPADLRRMTRRCAAALSLHPVPVLSSATAAAPLTIGFRRPVVILPADWLAHAPPDDLLSALAHELAHVRRRDFGFNLIFEMACLPVWFHPGTALIRTRLAQTRESACDEIAAHVLQSRARYAGALVRLARMALAASQAAPNYALGLFDTNALEERVMNLLKNTEARRRGPRAARWTLALLAGMSALGMSVFSLRLAAEDSNLERFAGIWEVTYEGKTFFTLRLKLSGGVLTGTAVHTTRLRFVDGELLPDTDETVTGKIIEARATDRRLTLKIAAGDDSSDPISLKLTLVGAADADVIGTPDQEKPWHFRRTGKVP